MSKIFLIKGGNFVNKGAEAMLYTCIYEIKKRDKKNQCIASVFEDYDTIDRLNKNYKLNFNIIKSYTMGRLDTLYSYNSLTSCIAKLFSILKARRINKEIYERMIKYDYMIDISGYQLSSQWGDEAIYDYLSTIILMKRCNINVILMPQSFGPFNYKGIKKLVMKHLIKKILSYCEVIYAREEEGYRLLTDEYHLTNVRKALDLVLQTKKIDYSLVFKEVPVVENFNIKDNSIAIIPNIRVFERTDYINYIDLYKSVIDTLMLYKKNVYIIYHSSEDIDICNSIKKLYKDENRVILINKNLSSIEYSSIVSKFDYIIASRYHSIVHAYKEIIPCVALGWATKYKELMENFGQEKYCVDIRTMTDIESFIKLIEDMNDSINNNKSLIIKGLEIAQENNIFKTLDEKFH